MIKNLFSVYGVQIYSVAITILFTPVLLSLVGADGFGLIGFFLVIQTVLQILDGGISGSLSRQAAISSYSQSCFNQFRRNIKIIQLILVGICILIITTSLLMYRNELFSGWFNSGLAKTTVNHCVLLMIVIICVKYIGLVARSVIIGFEKHKAISTINLLIATLRYPGAVLILSYVENDVSLYFEYQLSVMIVELTLLFGCSRRYLNKITIHTELNSSSKINSELSLRGMVQFSGVLWLLSLTWVLLSQIDKVTLSSTISLSSFGIYTLAVTASGAMLTLGVPLNQLLMPRLTKLAQQNSKSDFTRLLTLAFYTYVSVFLSITMLFGLAGEHLLYVWTGELAASTSAYGYLALLATGNFFAGLTNFAFLISYSKNELRPYSRRYIVYGAIAIPCSAGMAYLYHEDGAAGFWLIQNALFFAIYAMWLIKKYLYRVTHFLAYLVLPIVLINYLMFELVSWTDLYKSDIRIENAFSLLLMISLSLIGNAVFYFKFIRTLMKKLNHECQDV
ncbi:lipopolysaccharide biosynthesis protein [Shewanella algae]|uniref:lipopolysaccharide biosynthesis protein n=1 Tax=Shewanella algae TaxID=38313 RepID=UPI001654E06F|nr:oligosaccharide flippase family protein [Shewanella algae]MBC8796429.1 oligosaccharide flippase family protein [Shewanella algae]